MKRRITSRILSLLLVFVLVLGSVPLAQIPVYAAGKIAQGSEGVLTGMGEIIAYEEMAPEIAEQTVPLGTDESADGYIAVPR